RMPSDIVHPSSALRPHRPRRPSLFPYTPLFRSAYAAGHVKLADGQSIPLSEFASRAAEDGMMLSAEATFSFPYPEETTPKYLPVDRKSTRLNSSHVKISYAVFCLKKKSKTADDG